MTNQEYITEILRCKSDMKNSIVEKGSSVGEFLPDYSPAILNISTGGAEIVSGTKFGFSTWSSVPEEYESYINGLTNENLAGLFYECDLLTSINMPNYVGGSIYQPPFSILSSAFYGCDKLSSINLPNMSSMYNLDSCFRACTSLTSLELPNLTFVGYARHLLEGSYRLINISLPKLEKGTSLESAFQYCTSLSSIDLPMLTYLDSLYSTFSGCSKLENVNLPKLEYVESMGRCFMNCSIIQELELPNLTRVNGNMSDCFSNCTTITSVSLPILESVGSMSTCFRNCNSLKSIYIPNLTTVSNLSNCFNGCSSLEDLEMGAFALSGGAYWGLSYCTRLTHQSLVNVISALSPVTKQTLTLGTTNLAKLNESEISVATSKGWTLN